MKQFADIDNVKEVRKETGLTQTEFWEALGVTQSGGSRYESGRKIPKAVRELIRIIYKEKIKLEDVKRKNFKLNK